MIGDFNAYLQSHEKKGPGNFSLGSATEFNAMIDSCSMAQLPSSGRKFTWSNNRKAGNVSAVLDRSFCNEKWLTIFQDSSQLVLPRIASDHGPLLMVSDASQRPSNCPFRFHQFWMEHEDFVRIVALSWSEWVPGPPILVLTSKLKRLKRDLKSWARSAFPNFDKDLEHAKKTLNQIHDQIASEGMNDHLFAMEADAKTGLMDCYKMDSLPGNEEIRRVVWELDPDSSPGPDGFSGAFFRKCWDMVEVEVCNAVKQFFSTGSMPNGINNNFLVLIPKVDGANTLEKFRPLCMGNVFCKIISKVMAMRLETLLPRLISEEQSAFQKGKMIHDNIAVASELANLMFSATRGGGLGLKIDIRKAYDTISWSFIFQVLSKFGFSNKWINWLHQLLLSTKISILVNGGPQGFFGVERGLRQGDPISPMLFIIAEEVLSRGLSNLVQSKSLKTISGPRGVTTPGHILFADDIFIFTNTSLRYVNALKSFLMKYQDFSGQCINFEKSKLFLGKIAPAHKQTIADTLGIQICTFPTRYLGVEIFKGRVKKEALLPVMDKVKGRLAGWKGKLLSLAGRTELVRSVIAGIPNHSFAIYWWPFSLLSIMERWMRNFIWTGDTETARKITVKWDSLCMPKEEGGLGIRRLRDTNKAMLCKLAWRIKHERTASSSFLKARFVKKDGKLKKGVSSSIALGVKKVWRFVEDNERWIIGNGNLTNFWKDKWWGPKSVLEELESFDLTTLTFTAKVREFICGGEWALPEVRSAELRRIFEKIKQIKIPSGELDDTCCWSLSTLGNFSTASGWECIRRKANKTPWSTLVWRKGLPPRFSTLGWRLAHGRLPTDEQIRHKGIYLASRCALCNQGEDSIDHIFLRCSFGTSVWKSFTDCFDVRWKMHQSINNLISWWKTKGRVVNLKTPWMMGFSIIAANIWWERNRRRHDNSARNDKQIFDFSRQEICLCIGKVKGEVKSPTDVMCCRRLGLSVAPSRYLPPLEVPWCKPHPNWLKLNVDGSALGNPGRAGAGGVARDHDGQVQDAFSIFLGIKQIYEAEFEAVMEGFLMAKALDAKGLCIESDSVAVVTAIQSNHIPWFTLQKWLSLLPFLESIP
ncbi:uncharacterized protein LOC122066747 [Macadamia integrifolia]|uniref:uncharacterized protein LOC122066747 n=1 Tax=Macadamia integrifolia TaxID=60698 RepID=UPI001C4F2541|nr:uncharacterized protein LOC122066747 [Macadamia integrifolia]